MPNEVYMIENEIADPKSSVSIIELPCGLLVDQVLHKSAKVREITGAEEDLLANDKIPNNRKMDELLISCTEALGPYGTIHELRHHIPNLLIGDRVALLLAIRRVSLGDLFPFRVTCPNPECKKESLFDVNLGDLEVKEMPIPEKRVYTIETPRKVVVVWHPMNGVGEAKLASTKDREARVTMSMLARIDTIDGKPATLDLLKRMGTSERSFIREAFEEAEGGVDTGVELTCPYCDHEFATDLEIGQRGFFFPSATRKAWKPKSNS